ncbi:hypothetical protein NST83_07180 [Paenibacillus sp. FSL R10-2782]|uniref:Uncharacterized protein n=1 Tax=Paenibacillus terrae TaxID=159743 RepID=A0A4U2PZM8_9BACL|nr:hypothetical protein [Paenibacillus terrae]TKH44329.1 hypothetical protein C1I60_13490 [Paenibacillus terrae]
MSDLYTKKEVEDYVTNVVLERPLSVSIAAILLIFNGALLLVTQLLTLNALNEASTLVGICRGMFQGFIALLGLSGATAGVGMLFGKKWAWWLAVFYFTYETMRYTCAILLIPDVPPMLGGVHLSPALYYVKYGMRIVWNLLFTVYMCRSTVSGFFQTSGLNKWKACILLFSINGVMVGIGWWLMN